MQRAVNVLDEIIEKEFSDEEIYRTRKGRWGRMLNAAKVVVDAWHDTARGGCLLAGETGTHVTNHDRFKQSDFESMTRKTRESIDKLELSAAAYPRGCAPTRTPRGLASALQHYYPGGEQ